MAVRDGAWEGRRRQLPGMCRRWRLVRVVTGVRAAAGRGSRAVRPVRLPGRQALRRARKRTVGTGCYDPRTRRRRQYNAKSPLAASSSWHSSSSWHAWWRKRERLEGGGRQRRERQGGRDRKREASQRLGLGPGFTRGLGEAGEVAWAGGLGLGALGLEGAGAGAGMGDFGLLQPVT